MNQLDLLHAISAFSLGLPIADCPVNNLSENFDSIIPTFNNYEGDNHLNISLDSDGMIIPTYESFFETLSQKLETFYEQLNYSNPIGKSFGYSILKELTFASGLGDISIDINVENEIVLYQKIEEEVYKNISLDEDGSLTLEFIAPNPKDSIFKQIDNPIVFPESEIKEFLS